jgi:peptide-methionine (R)-S-oxide reductase
MIDRRILLASVAGLFGLAAFRWLRATPAQVLRNSRSKRPTLNGARN